MANKQEDLINYLVDLLSGDEHVQALYLKGSLARGDHDDYSDIDFYCLINEQALDQFLSKRLELLSGYRPIKYHSYVNFGYDQIILIYDNHLHLDFYVLTQPPKSGEVCRVLYDPNNHMKDYQVDDYNNHMQLVDSLSTCIYTIHELDVAIKRQDWFWADRLVSHILADLGLVFCHTYNDKPVLHLKNLEKHLPEVLLKKINHVKLASSYEEKVRRLICLIGDTINMQSQEVVLAIETGYLDFMHQTYFSCQLINSVDLARDIMLEAAHWGRRHGKNLWSDDALSIESLLTYYKPEEFHVLVIDGVPAACMVVQYKDDMFWPGFDDQAAYLHKLCVSRSFSGQGVACLMIDQAKAMIEAKDIHIMRLDTGWGNQALCDLYEENGFKLYDHFFLEEDCDFARYEWRRDD